MFETKKRTSLSVSLSPWLCLSLYLSISLLKNTNKYFKFHNEYLISSETDIDKCIEMIEMEAFIVSVTEVALLNAHSQTKMKTGIQTDLLPLLFNGHVFLWILLHHLKSKTEKFRFLQNAASTFSFLDVYLFHWAFHCLALFTIQTISNSASGLQLIIWLKFQTLMKH